MKYCAYVEYVAPQLKWALSDQKQTTFRDYEKKINQI